MRAMPSSRRGTHRSRHCRTGRASAPRACAAQCQLRHRRPDLEVVVLRGNVEPGSTSSTPATATRRCSRRRDSNGSASRRASARDSRRGHAARHRPGRHRHRMPAEAREIRRARASARARTDPLVLDAERAFSAGSARAAIRRSPAHATLAGDTLGSRAGRLAGRRHDLADDGGGPECAMPRRSAPSSRCSSLAAAAGEHL